MSALAYINADLLVGGYRLQSQFNELNIEQSAEMLDQSVFGVTTRIMKGGLLVSRIAGGGLAAYGTGSVEALLFGEVGSTAEIAVAAFPNGIAEGEATGYAMEAWVADFTVGAPVGALIPFTTSFEHGSEL